MSRRRRWTRRAAVGSLATGLALSVTTTEAVTQISADRAVEFTTTADDTTALFPLRDESARAALSDSDASTTIYTILDNDTFPNTALTADITDVTTVEGDEIGPEALVASLSETQTQSGSSAVTVTCADTADSFSGSYTITLQLGADTDAVTVTATRTTAHSIDIDCRDAAAPDYSQPVNYSDAADGDAAQPGAAATGVVTTPGNVNNGDPDSVATLTGAGGSGLNVGFTLPSVPAASTYTLRITAPKVTGSLAVTLVDNTGTQLTPTYELPQRDKPEFTLTITPNKSLAERAVFLIFTGGTRGKNSSELASFQLSPQ